MMYKVMLFVYLLANNTPIEEPVLINFYSEHVKNSRLNKYDTTKVRSAGYRIRMVNVERNPYIVKKYNVSNVPYWIILYKGQEIDKEEGFKSSYELIQLLENNKQRPYIKPSSGTITKNKSNYSTKLKRLILRATARISVEEGLSTASGSGTVIKHQDTTTLILTCGHIFRGRHVKGKTVVTMFTESGSTQKVVGELILHRPELDLAIIKVPKLPEVVPINIVRSTYQPTNNEHVISSGCELGNPPKIKDTNITGINEFVGPSNIETTSSPIGGSSGGGLFNLQGKLMGVCTGRNLLTNEGIYVGVPDINNFLKSITENKMKGKSDITVKNSFLENRR